MANTIITKNSATASAVPTSGQLVQGELAVNVTDKRLFTEDSGGTVVELGTNPSSLTAPNITDNTTTATLKYSGAAKLATTATGIDVTGTVVSDGLTVDSGSATNNVEIVSGVPSTTTGTSTLTLRPYNAGTGTTYSRAEIIGESTGAGDTDLVFKTTTTSTGSVQRMRIDDLGDISFYEDTGTTAKFFWDASAESLGIGTAAPAEKLNIVGGNVLIGTDSGSAFNGNAFLRIQGSSNAYIGIKAGTAASAGILFGDTDDSFVGGMQYSNVDNALLFNAGNAERLRIDASGNLLVGATNNAIGNAGFKISQNGFARAERLGTTSQTHIAFANGNGDVGGIATNGTTTSYNTSSDYRLKEDWQPMTGASERVKALKPVNFAWKSDGSRVDGFLAHEAQAVVPEAVTGEKDAVELVDIKDEDGNVTGQEERPVYQGIDQSKLVPLLTAALQEALAKIESLEARLDAANL